MRPLLDPLTNDQVAETALICPFWTCFYIFFVLELILIKNFF